jgi:hypothetical protein
MSGGFVPDPKVFRIPGPGAVVGDTIKNRASNLGDQIYEKILDYEAKLDEAHEVGARLVSFGQTVTFHLEGMECMDPSLVCFFGTTDANEPVELIQHVTQISILLTKVPLLDPKKKRLVGFGRERDDLDEEKAEDE